MIAEEDEHQFVVAVVLHVREQAAQRICDGGSVVGPHSLGISGQDGFWLVLCRRHPVEDGAVTYVAPSDESRDRLPWRVA